MHNKGFKAWCMGHGACFHYTAPVTCAGICFRTTKYMNHT